MGACFNIENRDGEARRLRSSLRPQPLYVAAELQNTIPALEKSCAEGETQCATNHS